MVLSFKYLGRVISAADNDWTAVTRNMTQARAVWRRTIRILIWEVARSRVSISFFKLAVPLVLLFGVETWVVTPLHGKVHGGFPVPGGAATDGVAPATEDIRELGVHLGKGGESGGRV